MYYIKYNEIDLSDIVKVRSVEIPSLPSIKHSSIDVFERHGNIFNGVSYNNRDINLVLLIYPDNPDDYDIYINDVKRTFYTQEECRLFCGNEDLYIWCVPTGDIVVTELGDYCAEIEVNLIAYDPYWYSVGYNIVNNDDKKQFRVTNKSDLAVYPILKVGFTKDTTFVQIENQTSKEKLLIGGIPSVEGEIIKKDSKILADACENTSGWTSTSAPIESDRSTGGSITVNKGGWGFVLSDAGSGSTTWKGSSYKKQLSQPVKDFKVRVCMTHNSGGVNGDPSYPYENNPTAINNDIATISTGSKTIYYYIVTPSGVTMRSDAGSGYAQVCTIPSGVRLTPLDMKNGWIKATYNSKTGWCDMNYLTPTIYDSTVVTNPSTGQVSECNYVVVKSTALRKSADKTATNVRTIPAGTVIRVITSQKYPTTHEDEHSREIFYKLAKAYNGSYGYVLIDDLIEASNYEVQYAQEQNTADDKTGVVELYGFSANNIQLFKLSMNDKSEWYEHTYPSITKNGTVFLEDSATTPNAKTRVEYNDNGKKVSNILSGKVNNGWNEFNGELYIERVNNQWYAYVQNKKDGQVIKEIKSKTVTDTKNSTESLSYIVMYFGTTKSGTSDSGTLDKCSDMSISHIEVKTATEIDNTIHYNFLEFEVGDVLTIDHNIPSVRLNDVEHNELIDVGSVFFKLEPGENIIRVASDDTPNIDVLWTNKRL